MNIIFGDAIKLIPDKYTILELDTFYLQEENLQVPTYCVVEKIPLSELLTAQDWMSAHQDMLIEYRKRNWKFVEDACSELKGRWSGELDTFYDEMTKRCAEYKENPPPMDWDGLVNR